MPNQPRITTKKITSYIAIYIITALSLFFLQKFVGANAIIDSLLSANLFYIFCSFILSLIFSVLSGLKLKMFVEVMGYRIGWIKCQKITFATFPLNVALPSKSGDLAKSWSMRKILPVSQGVGIVILDRLIDLILLCLMSMAGSAIIQDLNLFIISLSVLLFGITGMFILNKARNINNQNIFLRHINDIGYATRYLLNNRKYLILIFTISILIWIGSAFQIYLLYLAVGEHIPITACIAVVPIAILIGTLPITIAGMGTRDLSLVYLFSAYTTNPASFSVGILFSFLRYWILAFIGIPFLSELRGNRDNITSCGKHGIH